MRRVRMAALLSMLSLLPIGGALADGTPPAREGGVAVYRGPGSGPLPAPPPASAERRTLGGKTLWRVDEGRGTAVACRMEGTMMVGQRRLRCARGRLPEP